MEEPMEVDKPSEASPETSSNEIDPPLEKPPDSEPKPAPPAEEIEQSEPTRVEIDESLTESDKLEEKKADEPNGEEEAGDPIEKKRKVGEEGSTSEFESDSANELAMPPKETFGKGKRARIPNKRYSDILLSPTTTVRTFPPKLAENGAEREVKQEGEDASSAKKPKIIFIDIKDPKYKKPFQFGWRRELVYRMNTDLAVNKQIGDVYYFSPTGRKFRSRRELTEHLVRSTDLNIDNFTFHKEPVGMNDPDKEIVRDAKVWPRKSFGVETKLTPQRLRKPLPASEPQTTPTSSPRVKTNTRNLGNIKVKLPPSKTKSEKQKERKAEEETVESEAKRSSKRITKSNLDKPCQPCSIRCDGLMGSVPTLQCRLCLCLYHYECIGLTPQTPNIEPFICKNCQLEHGTTKNVSASAAISLPPLTPINTLKSISSTTTSSSILPKLQRIPRNNEIQSAKDPTNVPNTENNNKSLVGAVTSWLPHSSTIQLNSQQTNKENKPIEAPPRPQYIEYMGGRKFLIIPKHNVVSVSPPSIDNNNKIINANNKADIDDGGRRADEQLETLAEAQQKRRQSDTSNNTTLIQPINRIDFGTCYMQNLSYGFRSLLHVFQYLKVQDLLRASCVCRMWHDIASHPILWRTVRMKNSQVHSFEGLANSLKRHGTIQLDLRKMLLPSGNDDIWPEFSKAIANVETLRKIELCRCPASVVEELLSSNKNLEVINAVTIKCTNLNLSNIENMKNIKELRLKSTSGFSVDSNITTLKDLTSLTHLSLTSIKSLNELDLSILSTLNNLESLDLGECNNFPATFGCEILLKLEKLEKLRLERGQGDCHTFEILNAIQNMPKLEQLELVNFDIKAGFDTALGECANIKKLLIIPTYISQSATTNHMVLGGVLRLQSTLTHFVWGVTLELLRVTELFVDQCEDAELKEKKEKKNGNGDSIPVLKPVPTIVKKDDAIAPAHDPPQVEILPLPNLQKLLLLSLPTTRVKILKIPFHATWRQSITDTVN